MVVIKLISAFPSLTPYPLVYNNFNMLEENSTIPANLT